MSMCRDMMPAWELRAALDASEAECTHLRAENERLRKDMGDARVVWGEARDCLLEKIIEVSAENKRLRELDDLAKRTISITSVELAKRTAQIEKLRAALKTARPFVGWAGHYPTILAEIDAALKEDGDE